MADEAHTEETPLKPLGLSAGAADHEEGSDNPIQNNPSKYEKFVPGLAGAKKHMAKSDNTPTSKATAILTGFEICCGSIFVTILMLILSALPIAMIVIGALNIHKCPGMSKIPIWLIVFGAFALLQTIINGLRRCVETVRKDNSMQGDEDGAHSSITSRGGGCCEGLISLFLFAWLIVGSVWVFGYWHTYIYSSTCVPKEICCAPVAYWFSFITLIVIYAGALLSLLICCCCCCCIASVVI